MNNILKEYENIITEVFPGNPVYSSKTKKFEEMPQRFKDTFLLLGLGEGDFFQCGRSAGGGYEIKLKNDFWISFSSGDLKKTLEKDSNFMGIGFDYKEKRMTINFYK